MYGISRGRCTTHTYIFNEGCQYKMKPPALLFCPTVFCFSLIPTLDSYIGVYVHECKDYIVFFLTFWVMEVLVFLTIKEILITLLISTLCFLIHHPFLELMYFTCCDKKKGHFMCQKLKSLIPCFYVGSISLLFIFKNDFVTLDRKSVV